MLQGPLGPLGEIASHHPQDVERSVVAPLRVAGRLVGVLNVNTVASAEDLGAERLDLVRLLANQAAMIIEHARLYEDLARKERRLELFVDKFLRLQAEQRNRIGPISEMRLQQIVSNVLKETIQKFVVELRREPQPSLDHVREVLTERERQVLQLVVEGLVNKEIGQRLGLSPHTVKNHLVRITQKLGVADRTQAAVMAIRQGLLA